MGHMLRSLPRCLPASVLECPRKVVARVGAAPIGRGFLNQKVEKSVIGCRNGSPQTCLSWILRFLVEEKKSLLQQLLCERHRLHPARLLEMGGIGGEVKIRLKSPLIERLKFVNELRRHSFGDACKPGWLGCVGSQQNAEKYRRFAVGVWSKREADIADLAGVQQLGRLRHGFSELRLVYESGVDVHKLIIARPGWAWNNALRELPSPIIIVKRQLVVGRMWYGYRAWSEDTSDDRLCHARLSFPNRRNSHV